MGLIHYFGTQTKVLVEIINKRKKKDRTNTTNESMHCKGKLSADYRPKIMKRSGNVGPDEQGNERREKS